MRSGRLALYATLALLTLVWGTTWAVIRVGLQGIPPLTGVALRFGIAAVLLLLLTPFFGVRLGRQPHERWLWVTNALLTFCVSYGVLYWAEQWVPSGLAAVLFATFPLWVALFAHYLLPGEQLHLRGFAGVVLGFAGVAVIFSEDFSHLVGPHAGRAALTLLLSPFAAAIGGVLVKRWGKGIHALSITAVPMAITALVMGLLAYATERHLPVTFDRRALLALFYLAVFGSALTFTLYFALLQRLAATELSLLNYVIPVVAVAVGTFWLGEPLTLRIGLGTVLVVAGVALALRSRQPAPEGRRRP